MTRRSISKTMRVRVFLGAEGVTLSNSERGKGRGLSAERRAQIEEFCAQCVIEGYHQYEIARALGSTKSSVSRWVRAGMAGKATPAFVRTKGRNRDLSDRIQERIFPEPNSGCWLWTGSVGPGGYGSFTVGKAAIKAHRMVYERYRGAVPAGLVLDHICRNKICVNPDHLEPVTTSENVRRAWSRSRS